MIPQRAIIPAEIILTTGISEAAELLKRIAARPQAKAVPSPQTTSRGVAKLSNPVKFKFVADV